MPDHFAVPYGPDVTPFSHAVMSVGGNDFLDTAGCSMTQQTVESRVTNAINALRSAAPNSLQIIVIGYCTPTEAYADCSTPEQMATLNRGIAAAAAAHSDVTYIDSTDRCGGSNTSFSPEIGTSIPSTSMPKGIAGYGACPQCKPPWAAISQR